MDEDLKQSMAELSERDRKRLHELRVRRDEGTLSYTEKIELELLESQESSARAEDEEIMKAEERSDYDRLRKDILERTTGIKVVEGTDGGDAEKSGDDGFEILPADYMEEGATGGKSPPPRIELDPEKVKIGIAFGAGALMGYLMKDFLGSLPEEEDDEG